MAARFSAEEILEITSGRLASGMMPDGKAAIATDTRALKEGAWYLALCGEKFDGHDFIGDAFARGAVGCIVAERPAYPIALTTFPLIAVSDTLKAYHALARAWRRKVNPVVVAVTGSSGKTTTKEMCFAVLSEGLTTWKSLVNENNEFGVPRTILSMPPDTKALVVEMAMRGLGQISQLAETAEPDIGIIVNAGLAHLGPLASVDNIITAKCELLEHLDPAGGKAIIGQPTKALMDRVAQVFAGFVLAYQDGDTETIEVNPDYTRFTVRGALGTAADQVPVIFEVAAHGEAHLRDAWCAITAARELGLTDETIARGLRRYSAVTGRGNRLRMPNGSVIVDEAYNANPDSVRCSVEILADPRVFPQSKKYVVLGDLAELGDRSAELHEELGIWLKQKNISGLFTVGPLARFVAQGADGSEFEVLACQDQHEVETALRERLSADSCVLIKGSRAAGLDWLVSKLAEDSVTGGV